MDLDNIPDELRALPHWVIHRGDKHPRTLAGGHASVSDPSTWISFDEARNAVISHRAKGVGFVLSEDDPYCGIDLDNVISEDGKIDPEAQAIIDKLNSYTEVSQSGRGIHIICRGAKPTLRCRKKFVEIYDHGRYLIMTGDLWQDRGSVESRRKELDWLCSDVFGSDAPSKSDSPIDIVLDRNAKPPTDKLNMLLKDAEFKAVWRYNDSDLSSMSDYDWKLAAFAAEADWTDQEIADLIISFRRKNGAEEDVEKSMREDYIKRTIGKIRGSSPSAGVLGLLEFKVRRVKQLGEQDAEFYLELEGGNEVYMGSAEAFLSPIKAEARLYSAGLKLSRMALKKWKLIAQELLPLIERIATTSREDDAESWLRDYVGSRIAMPLIGEEGDISDIFRTGRNSIASDEDGRIFVRLSDIARYARAHSGAGGVSTKTVARDLINLGFSKRKISVTEEGRRRQISLWVSPMKFISPRDQPTSG